MATTSVDRMLATLRIAIISSVLDSWSRAGLGLFGWGSAMVMDTLMGLLEVEGGLNPQTTWEDVDRPGYMGFRLGSWRALHRSIRDRRPGAMDSGHIMMLVPGSPSGGRIRRAASCGVELCPSFSTEKRKKPSAAGPDS
jgi:hypothetical protein